MSYLPPVDQRASQLPAIFKYVPVRGEEELDRACAMIADRSLWFWHVTGQNDERECQPDVFWGGGFEEIYRYFLDDLREAFPDADQGAIERQARMAASNPQIPKPEQVYRMWAICCFSAARDCPYLWREYGADGAGIMIEYPTPEGSSAGLAGRVTYTDEPVRLDLLQMDESTMYRVFTTKTTQWRREREYRMAQRLDAPSSGRSVVFSDLKIASVTIGARLQVASAARVQQVCQRAGIEVRQAQRGLAADNRAQGGDRG
ncbi:MAG: hypothetical protein NXI31_26405 [bacterium]|nr:hypothetical protein [bacterium]